MFTITYIWWSLGFNLKKKRAIACMYLCKIYVVCIISIKAFITITNEKCYTREIVNIFAFVEMILEKVYNNDNT